MAGRTVYVGNVSSATDEGTLRDMFGRVGPVSDLRIAGKPGYNTVYCFVEFVNPSSAKQAVGMDGTKVGGRSVRVSMAKSSQSVPGSISARSGHPILPQLPYDPAFAAAITAYSAALQPSSLLQAEAQARLLQLPAFNAQLNASNIQLRNNVRPKKPHHDPGKVQRTVYVESVAGSVDEQGLADHFSQHGSIVAVRLASAVDTLKRKAWIEFASEEAATSAQSCCDVELAGSVMKVRPSRTAIHTNTLTAAPHNQAKQDAQATALANLQAHLPNHAGTSSQQQHTQQQQEQSSDHTSSTSYPMHSPPASRGTEMTHRGVGTDNGAVPATNLTSHGSQGPSKHAGEGHTSPDSPRGAAAPLAKRGLDKGTSTAEEPETKSQAKRAKPSSAIT